MNNGGQKKNENKNWIPDRSGMTKRGTGVTNRRGRHKCLPVIGKIK